MYAQIHENDLKEMPQDILHSFFMELSKQMYKEVPERCVTDGTSSNSEKSANKVQVNIKVKKYELSKDMK